MSNEWNFHLLEEVTGDAESYFESKDKTFYRKDNKKLKER